MVFIGEELDVRKPPIIRTYKVLEIIEKRVGPKLVDQYVQEITPKEELHKLELLRYNNSGIRERGTGRPTKKERRELDDFFDDGED